MGTAAPRPLALLLLLAAAGLAAAAAAGGAAAGAAAGATTYPAYPPIDGTGRSLHNPSLGAANTPFSRNQVPQDASSGSGKMAGANRPSAREVTLALTRSPYYKAASSYKTSALVTAMGQLVAQDTARTLSASPPGRLAFSGGEAPIAIPPGDPAFSRYDSQQRPLRQASRSNLSYERSAYERAAGGGPRLQLNGVTHWLDASVLYGSSEAVLRKLRTGTGGMLRDDGQGNLPLNVDPASGQPLLQMVNNAGVVPQTQLRLSGNPAVNQNPLPLVMTTLLLREHNRRAQQLALANPHADEDEAIFQEARKFVVAHFQQLALGEYLDGLGISLPPYAGFNASVDGSIDTFFATVAYRYGHSTVTDVLLRLDGNFTEHPLGHLPLMSAWFNPQRALEGGIEPLLRGLLVASQGEVEPRWAASVSGNMNGPSAVNGTDLAAINIQRGRDHGIVDYNSCREALGLPRVTSFANITSDAGLAATLQRLYGSVDNIDAYTGGLAERHHGASHVGQLFYTSIADQFTRLRDGDWFYYGNKANGLFSDAEIEEIRTTTLRDIIERNTHITGLPTNLLVASGGSACAAASSSGASSSSSNQVLEASMLGGSALLRISPSKDEGWVRVLLSADGAGWLGVGVAASADARSPMIGADMVVGRMDNGQPLVRRYHVPPGSGRIVPIESPADPARLRVVRFEQANGRVMLEFERPLAAAGNDSSANALAADAPATFIVARGTSNAFAAASDGHRPSDSGVLTVARLFGAGAGASVSTGATDAAVRARRAHGLLMALNFLVVMPLGALAARQLRCHWLRVSWVRAGLFYAHIAMQLSGVVIATVGFVLAQRTFGVPHQAVAYGHGNLGIAILALVYSQLLMGFLRPAARATPLAARRRHLWDICHALLGRSSMILGSVNVILGCFIFSRFTTEREMKVWAGLCASSFGGISLLQYLLDRQEKYAVLRNDAAARGLGGLGAFGNSQSGAALDDDAGSSAYDAPLGGGSVGGGSRLTVAALKRHDAEAAAAADSAGDSFGRGARVVAIVADDTPGCDQDEIVATPARVASVAGVAGGLGTASALRQ